MKRALFFLVFVALGYLSFGQNSYSKRRNLDVYSYSFDGVDSKVSFPNSDSLNLERTDAFSIETWVKLSTISGNQYLLNKYSGTGISVFISNGILNFIMVNSHPTNEISIQQADSAGYVLLFNSQMPINKWVQICITYDGSSDANGVKFYFNGKAYPKLVIYSNSLTGTIQNTQPVQLGSQSSSYSTYKQSVTRIFRKVLDSTEIAELYNNGVVNFNQNISRCVFDMQVRNDHFSTNYTVIDSALGNNGVTAGMTIGQKVRVDSMRGMVDMSVQTFTSNLYYKTFGEAGGGGDGTANLMMHSPFTDRFRTPIVYDFRNNQTYIGFVNRAGIGGSKQSRLLKILHDGKMVTPAGYADYRYAGECDGHLAPGITITPDNEILLVREWGHSEILYVEKTKGKSQVSLTPLTQLDDTVAYPQLTRIGSNLYMWLRSGVIVDELYKSSDNGATWGRNYVVSGFDQRPYSMIVYDSTKLRFMITLYNNSITRCTDNCYIESTDGITFYNADHSFSKNIVTDGQITKSELLNNCLASTTPQDTTNIMLKAVVKTPTGKIVAITNADSTHYNVVYFNGSTWQTKNLNIPNWNPPGYTQAGGRVDFFVLYPYSDSSFVFWRIEKRNGYDVIVEYRTTDFFDTIDAGTVISDPNTNHEQLQGTFNINDAKKIIIAANGLGATENKLFIYEFTP